MQATAQEECSIYQITKMKLNKYWSNYLRDSYICLSCALRSQVTQQCPVGHERNVNKKTCLQSGSTALSPKNTQKTV